MYLVDKLGGKLHMTAGTYRVVHRHDTKTGLALDDSLEFE